MLGEIGSESSEWLAISVQKLDDKALLLLCNVIHNLKRFNKHDSGKAISAAKAAPEKV